MKPYANSGPDTSERLQVQSRASSSAHLLLVLFMLSTLGLTLLNLDAYRDASLEMAAKVSALLVLATFISVYFCAHRNIWSYPVIYTAILGLFHFGIIGPYAFGMANAGDIVHAQLWWDRDTTPYAMGIATIGYLAVGSGVAVRSALQRPGSITKITNPAPELRQATMLVGAGLVWLSVITWFYVTLSSGGVSLLFKSYGEYLAATAGRSVVQFVWFGLGVGLCILASQGSSKLRNASLGVFGIFILFALPIGLRGEVLFSLSAAAAISVRHRKMPSTSQTLLGAAGLLFMISLLGEIRRTGIGSIRTVSINASLSEGLVELGHTFRSVTEVVTWHQVFGEPLIQGASYWAPVDRALCKLVNPNVCLPDSQDERLLNVLMTNRVGTWGFSPIAEAFWNFGVAGVVIIMFGIGVLVTWLNVWTVGPIREVAASVVFVELLIYVRNAFTAIPSHLVFGAVIIAGIWALSALLRQKDPLAVSTSTSPSQPKVHPR